MTVDLATWLTHHVTTPDYATRVGTLKGMAKLTTQAAEVTVICDLIERLRPALSIEIGSFFGQTSAQMAQAVAKHGGRFITVDPVGGHRMPGIIEQWPPPSRAVSEFRAVNSMELFSWVETETIRGRPTEIGVAFVDGNHRFEYALFDLLECGTNIAPGGAIIIDNMEQEGPRLAALHFLRLNPAWRLFFRGALHGPAATVRELAPPLRQGTLWAVLIAPTAVQVAGTGRVFLRRLREYAPVSGLVLNVVAVPSPVELAVNFQYVGRPPDWHLHGIGAQQSRRQVTVRIVESGRIEVPFAPPATLKVDGPLNVTISLEMSVQDEGGYVLLEPGRAFEVV